MESGNQGTTPESQSWPPPVDPAPEPAWAAPPPPDPAILRAEHGLRTWLLIVGVLGLAGLGLRQVELAGLTAVAGLFAVSHAADIDGRWRGLYRALAWLTPVGGALMFTSMALVFAQSEEPGLAVILGAGLSMGSALICLVTAYRPAAAAIAALLFRHALETHTLRLAARLVLIGVMFAVPGWLAFQTMSETLLETGQSPVGAGTLWSGMIGLTVLSLGGVGFAVRRTPQQTLERLGLGPLRPIHLVTVALGLVMLVGLNFGAEWMQRRYFPELWQSDQEASALIAGELGQGETLLLGFSAGIGEELTLRGALQPRLGLVPTSLLFALLHVQYSWVGMAVILVLGMLLGWIRQRTNTTVAVLVHVLYDIIAVMSLQPLG